MKNSNMSQVPEQKCSGSAKASFPKTHNDTMAIEWWPLSKLYIADDDPRRYSKRDIKKAVNIIKNLLSCPPLTIASDGRILATASIFIAAQKLGLPELPVIQTAEPSPVDRRVTSLALNRLYELGKFDRQKMANLIEQLEFEIPDLDLTIAGLDEGEIVDFTSCLVTGEEPIEDLAPSSSEPITQLGDIWILGDHRIGCGDAADEEFLAKLLEGEKAAMVFTDPPYGCKVGGFVTTRDHKECAQALRQMLFLCCEPI